MPYWRGLPRFIATSRTPPPDLVEQPRQRLRSSSGHVAPPGCQPIRKPGRLWQPIAPTTTQDQLQRAAHRHPVPGRHHQRRHAVPTAQHPADLFALVLQWHMLATGKAWLSVMPHQRLLRHADGRQPGHHAKVRRNAEPARMGDALPVAEHQVRPLRQSSERLQQRRQFTARARRAWTSAPAPPPGPAGGSHRHPATPQRPG